MALSRVKVWGNEILYPADLNAEFNNIINNAASLISPIPGGLDWDGYAHTLDAAGATTTQSSSNTAWYFIAGTKAGTPGTTGYISTWNGGTYTDTATAGSGTLTKFATHWFARPTLAATNSSVTTTDAANLYVVNSPFAGSNETLTNAWSLWVDDGHVRLDGDIQVQADIVGTINKYSLTASVAANALTIALKDRDGSDASASTPLTFKFRSTTGGTGTYTLGTVSAALSTVVSSGSTLGTVSATAHRLHIGALLTGSTVELCYWNSQSTNGIISYHDTELITTTAEGGAGAADTAGTMYSTTARAGVPWVYLGYIESTQATAGTWATTPSKVQTWYEGMLKPGDTVQTKYTTDSATATGSTAILIDDSIPQNTEGDQYMSLAITPTNAVNILQVEHGGQYESVGGALHLTLALFQDSTANALTARASYYGANAENNWLTLHYRMAAGTTSATTFKIRAGANANSLRFNGFSGSRVYGGACYSYLKVTEIFA
jgi:hypothetical protein